MDITTVADDLVVMHDGERVHRFDGLSPDSDHEFLGHRVRTLPRPSGELLCRFATVNDVHFGELECGRIDDDPRGPIQRSGPGESPYPETMNRAAVREIAEIDPIAVFVKGDLTCTGTEPEFAAFEACYRPVFGDRLHVVRGNHDSYLGQHLYDHDQWVDLPGIAIALIDTAIPTETTGDIGEFQLRWLDERAAATTAPVLVMGHHQQWTPGAQSDGHRSEGYFGINPDASDGLNDVVARRRNILGYTAGHTHRHRVRSMACGAPTVEIGCVKDFPGTWAEYRVYEGGVMQVVHRISDPAALDWSERCRHLYHDFGIDYETYALGTLAERCFVFPDRTR